MKYYINITAIMNEFMNAVESGDCELPGGEQKEDIVSNVDYTPVSGDPDWVVIITKTGAFINYGMLDINHDDILTQHKAIRKIENYFTMKTMQAVGGMKQIKRCRVDKKNKRIIVPRFGIFEVLTDKYALGGVSTKAQLKPGDRPITQFHWNGELRPNQKLIYNYLHTNIYNDTRLAHGSAGCILDLEAGQGKSFLAAYLISKFRRKTAIVLHSTSILEQWENDVLRKCYPNINIGYYYGKKKKDGDVVLMIINSVVRSKEFVVDGKTMTPLEYFNQFGFMIYDECHTYANKNAGKAFGIAQTPYMLGLSATPNENVNKFDKMVWWALGPVVSAAAIPGYIPTDKDFTGVVHRMNYYGSPLYTRLIKNATTDMTSVTETISMICEDQERIALIIKAIQECREKSLYTFVFADRRDYLETIKCALEVSNKELCDEAGVDIMTDKKDYMRIVGGAKGTDLKTAENHAKVIFTTYQYMGTGKSIVKMNGLVLATPRKTKMGQYIKRIFRLGSDSSITRHVYDIVDMKLVLKNQWYSRNRYYKSQGFEVKETKTISAAAGKPKSARVRRQANATKKRTLLVSSIIDKLR